MGDRISNRPRRLLIAANHLRQIGGSEVIAFEIARHFAAEGCDITVFANSSGSPMGDLFEAVTGKPIINSPREIKPFTFDMAYVHHQVLGLFNYRPSPEDRESTRIVTGRLARVYFLESGGWLHDKFLVDHVLANSEVTGEHLLKIDHGSPMTVFYNAAPESFFRPFTPKPTAPRRVLVVSSTGDAGLGEVIATLRRSVQVEHIGYGGDRSTLVTPRIIASTDAIVSIGKTIVYGLVGRVPVYIYDHYGGPGYLDASNAAAAMRFNFAGRCCERRLPGEQIAAEIISDYAKGVAFARDVPQAWLDRFSLPRYLDLLREPALVSNAEKRQRLLSKPFIAQERLLAAFVRKTHLERLKLHDEMQRLQDRLAAVGA